jgi:glycosyltransferase involved in cell wall biosynthesis
MLITIGILARNEETRIAKTLSSLFEQTALRCGAERFDNVTWEIIVVANGCSDDTAKCASEALEVLRSTSGLSAVDWQVHQLIEGGKSNAWNHLIHDLMSKSTQLVVMLDADIEFGEKETIENCVSALLRNPSAVVAVDQPLKDAVREQNLSLVERASLAISRQSSTGATPIAGSFYCARAQNLREIWMPKGLSGEDGFLRSMIITDCFRKPPDPEKIIRAPEASHYFETLTSPAAIFRHELRLVIGTALNCYLTWDLLYLATDPKGPGAGVVIRNRLAENPRWYSNVVTNAIRNRGWWVLPRGMLFRRFKKTGSHESIAKNIQFFALSTAAFLFDLIVFTVANRKLKRGDSVGFW